MRRLLDWIAERLGYERVMRTQDVEDACEAVGLPGDLTRCLAQTYKDVRQALDALASRQGGDPEWARRWSADQIELMKQRTGHRCREETWNDRNFT